MVVEEGVGNTSARSRKRDQGRRRLAHELEGLTKSRDSELIVLARHWEFEPPL
jgi:hypothetical protein